MYTYLKLYTIKIIKVSSFELYHLISKATNLLVQKPDQINYKLD